MAIRFIWAALAVLLFVSDAQARFPRGGTSSVFQGSPVATISSITPVISCSSSSGVIPVFILCSNLSTALGSRTDGSALKPYEDLEASWNFGDSSGTENFTLPTSGAVVNLNNGQVAPSAAYAYRNVGTGTYTITMTVRGCAGGRTAAGTCTSVVSQSTSTNITVTDWAGSWTEKWADSANSPCAVSCSGSLADPFNSVTLINGFIEDGDNKVLHIKKGSSFSGSVSLGPWQNHSGSRSGLRIDTYGSGALPSFNISSGNAPALKMGGSVQPALKDDVVVSGLAFSTSGSTDLSGQGIIDITNFDAGAPGSKVFSNIVLDNVVSTSALSTTSYTGITAQGVTGGVLKKFFVWNPTITNPVSMGAATDNISLYANTDSWLAVVGGTLVGGTGSHDTIRNHFLYTDSSAHALYLGINFGGGSSGLSKAYCINGNGPAGLSQYWTMTDSLCSGVQHLLDTSGANNEVVTTQFQNVVGQRNGITGMSFEGNIENFYAGLTHTWRDNRFYNNALQTTFSPNQGLAAAFTNQFYRNKGYIPSSASAGSTINYATDLPGTYTFTNGSNNITFPTGQLQAPVGLPLKFSGSPPSPFNNSTFYYVKTVDLSSGTAVVTVSTTPGGGGSAIGPASTGGTSTGVTTKWVTPQTFAYNQFVDARASNPWMFNWTFADMLAAGVYVDYNGYCSTAGQTSLFADAGSGRTFAQWQGAGGNWDANGSDACPSISWSGNTVTQWSDMN